MSNFHYTRVKERKDACNSVIQDHPGSYGISPQGRVQRPGMPSRWIRHPEGLEGRKVVQRKQERQGVVPPKRRLL
jgi:hypothetical protein